MKHQLLSTSYHLHLSQISLLEDCFTGVPLVKVWSYTVLHPVLLKERMLLCRVFVLVLDLLMQSFLFNLPVVLVDVNFQLAKRLALLRIDVYTAVAIGAGYREQHPSHPISWFLFMILL